MSEAFRVLPDQNKTALVQMVHGMGLPLKAARLLMEKRGLKRYAILPLLVSTIVYLIALGLLIWAMASWQPQVSQWDFLWGLGGYLSTAINYIIGPLKWIVFLPLLIIVCYFSFTLVGMIIASPFNDLLSEKVEDALCNPQRINLGWRLTAWNMLVSLRDTTSIILRQVLVSILVLPFLLVPVVGFLPLFLVTAYYTGLGFIDVAMARNNLRNRHKKPVFREFRWAIFGIGLAMELVFMIPFIGLIMLPVGVAAGTMLYCTCDWHATLSRHQLDPPKGFVPPWTTEQEAVG